MDSRRPVEGVQLECQKRIKSLRDQKGISRAQMCRDTDIRQDVMYKYETCQRIPSVEHMIAISDYLGVNYRVICNPSQIHISLSFSDLVDLCGLAKVDFRKFMHSRAAGC